MAGVSARRHPCTALKHLQRVASLVARRLEGCAGWRDCLAFVRQQEVTPGSPWHLGPGEAPLSDSQVRRYLRHADSEIRASVSKDRQRLFDQHAARREMLYKRCVGAGEYVTALSILKDATKLHGLYPPPKGKDTPAGCEPVTVQFILVPGTAPQREPVPALLPPESTATVAAEPDSQEPVHLVHPAEAD
jgi:hypothetical protein